MVLTRSAAKSLRSIVRWLPNEVLSLILCQTPQQDLITLCRTSRLMHNLATPVLYHSIVLCSDVQIALFVKTMEIQVAAARLVRYVRRIAFSDPAWDFVLTLLPTLVKRLLAVLRLLNQLESLDFGPFTHRRFTDFLEHAHFPNLLKFSHLVEYADTSITSFVQRHHTLTDLTLPTTFGQNTQVGSCVLDLPCLQFFCGPVSALSALKINTDCFIEQVALIFASADLALDDGLRLLSLVVELQRIVFLPTTMVLDLELLEAVAVHLPRVEHIFIERKLSPSLTPSITRDNAPSFVPNLRKFPELSFLSFNNEPCDPLEHHHLETMSLWTSACKTLCAFKFNGNLWGREPVNGTLLHLSTFDSVDS
ncbi:hypothetical protein R3P38DRAFT_2883615 [Favolaschia claudopus]|uniref:F-box domain-containing protein n=1 Tax=Favolaschia claudopus TaxID=2862362 RepID=A0AAW0CVU0_9AGAR